MTRKWKAFELRVRAAIQELLRGTPPHPTNGDEEAYATKIASFTKGLSHDDLGQVDPGAYRILTAALESQNITDFEALTMGGRARLIGPMSGAAFGLQGADARAVAIAPPHAFSSASMAVEMAELYWMTLLRDVPFADYAGHALVRDAIDDLKRFPEGPLTRDLMPETLFLAPYPGLAGGPRVSQFLLLPFNGDGTLLDQKIEMPVPVSGSDGIDFLGDYDEWLNCQRGFPVGHDPAPPKIDPTRRYIRNVRDMGWSADQGSLTPTYLKASLILLGFGRKALDDANPYRQTRKVSGLGTFDIAHLQNLLGHVATARHLSFQKWRHRRLRPEAFGGRLHNHLTGAASYPIHDSLLKSSALERIRDYNAEVNRRRGFPEKGTFLLPVLFGDGAPLHPSYPAGHALAAGVGVTMLKAWFKEDLILPDALTVKPSGDGVTLEPYVAGRDGPPLTIGGELNKLAYNITWGRNMSGVHYRQDGLEGNRFGEEIAIRVLRESRNLQPEPFTGLTLTRFDGTTITT